MLINGAEGIGTGWSTSIPNYNPKDLVDNMKRLLAGEQPVEMQPWYRDFSGTIMEVPSKTAGKSYTLNGVVSQVWNPLVVVKALPCCQNVALATFSTVPICTVYLGAMKSLCLCNFSSQYG